MIPNKESHTVEFKLVWRDDFLKQICAFANTQGGVLYLGVDDRGNIIGLDNTKRLLDDLPNKILNKLGIVVQISLYTQQKKNILKVSVEPSNHPVSLQGKFYKRIGSTTQELNGTSLQNFLLSKSPVTWDEYFVEGTSEKDIDQKTLNHFIGFAIDANRLPISANKLTPKDLFKQLHLIDKKGQLNRAAILAFGKNPEKFFPSTTVKIGRFISDTDMVSQDILASNIFNMLDELISIIKSKYLQTKIAYKGLQRIEQLELPEIALREALLNALIHRDYTGTHTQIRVNNDSLQIWNAGLLPETLSIELLNKIHPSWPRNRSLANIFFKAGYIETWGRGTLAMNEACKNYGLALPKYTEKAGGFAVEFFRQTKYTPQVTPQDTPQVTPQVARLLEVLEGELTRDDLQLALNIKDREYFRQKFLKPALEKQLIEMTLPDKPNSKNQKYRKTMPGHNKNK